MNKRTIAFLCILVCMLVGLFSISLTYAGVVTEVEVTSSEDLRIAPGVAFTSTISMESFVDTVGFQLKFLYDDNTFEVTDVRQNDDFTGDIMINYGNPGEIIINYSEPLEPLTGIIPLIDVDMIPADLLDYGEHVLFETAEDFNQIVYRNDLYELFNVEHVVYEFKPVECIRYGDVNMDGVVTIMDALSVQLYLAELTEITDLQQAIADVNLDGQVTIMDVLYIQLYLAELRSYLGPEPGIEPYLVTFYDSDGETVLGTSTVNYGESAVAPEDPTKADSVEFTYVFDGWDKDFSDVRGNMDVFATYQETIRNYTVTFLDDDGTLLKEEIVPYGLEAIAPSDPFKEHHTFIGWDEDFDHIVADLIVTAQYAINQYTVTFETFEGNPMDPIVLDYGTDLDDYQPEREGYLFDGWYLEDHFETLITTVPAHDVTVYATWVEEIIEIEPIDLVQVGEKGTTYTIPTETDDSGTTTVSGGYLMATTETTYELWYEVRLWAETNGYLFQNQGREGSDGTIGAAPTDNKLEPVTEVSWRDTIVWMNAASEMFGYDSVYRAASGDIIRDSRDSNGSVVDSAIQTENNGYRLPTSYEWEMAARWRNSDGDGSILVDGRYWTLGDYASGATADYNNETVTSKVAWYADNSEGTSHPVGEKTPNHLGFYDMSGNVWEWTYDWHPSYVGSHRILRGGGYYYGANLLQIGGVGNIFPSSTYSYVGFRMVRTAPFPETMHRVTFDGDGGTLISGEETQDILYGSPATPPVYEKDGHTFLGWSEDFGFITGDLEVLALWGIHVIYAFETNGGSSVDSTMTYELDESPVTSKAGYEFMGWYDNTELSGDPIVFPYRSDVDVTLYAKWVEEHTDITDMVLVGEQGWSYTIPTGFNDSETATVIGGYLTATTETTYELWYEVRLWAEPNGYLFQNQGREGNDGIIGAAPTLNRLEPVTRVSWRDIVAWLNAASELSGLDPVYYTSGGDIIRDSRDSNGNFVDTAVQTDHNGYRLPTSYEWEMAARWRNSDGDGSILVDGRYWTPGSYASGATTDYHDSTATGMVAWYLFGSKDRTHPVGEKIPNHLGLYDMSGNVWEWTYTPNYSARAIRGGSCDDYEDSLPVGRTEYGNPYDTTNDGGFRMVRTAPFPETTHRVTFDGGGGTLVSGEEIEIVPYGSSATPPVYEKQGHTFLGWSEDFGFIRGDLEVLALWGINVLYTFETHGGSSVDPITTYELDESPETSKAGYYFMGWYDNIELSGNSVIFPYRSDVDVMLYAKWVEEGTDITDMVLVGDPGRSYTVPTGWDDSGTTAVVGGYLTATTETTYEQWHIVRMWAETNGYHFQNQGSEGNDGIIGAAPTANKHEPVTEVSWRDIVVWMNALSEMAGFDPVYRTSGGDIIRDSRDSNGNVVDGAIQTDHNGYRLPTLDEWEMAARWRNHDGDGSVLVGGRYWTPGTYASGATADCDNSTATGLVAWYLDNSDSGNGRTTHPVGEKMPNHLGLYDMSGNVWELIYDYGDYRKVRGGQYNNFAGFLQVSDVYARAANEASSNTGFRVARNTPIPETTHRVTFDGDGGTLISGEETQDILYGLYAIPPVYEKESHTLIGWSEDISFISRDLEVLALWGIHVIYGFETNGGSFVDSIHTYALDQSPVTSKAGYDFMGWYDNIELSGDPIVFPYRSDVDVTLYAKWVEEDTEITDMIVVGEKGTTYTIPTGTDDSGTAQVEGGYLMATTETTYELWYEVRIWAETNGYHFQNQGAEGHDGTIGAAPTENRLEPVTTINWCDVVVWMNAASEMFGYEPVYRTEEGDIIRDARDSNESVVFGAIQTENSGYRLPTSDEWEMAARWRNSDGDGSILVDGRYWTPGSYASGATADYNRKSATGKVGWYWDNSPYRTCSVGEKTPNHLGFYDMSGNVWEWTYDWNPSCLIHVRIIRGGSFFSKAYRLRVGEASNGHGNSPEGNYGFRMVRVENIQIIHHITFDGTGGTLIEGDETQDIIHGDPVVPPIYEKEGHTFIGWSEDIGSITEDMEIDALWSINTYTITFDSFGGNAIPDITEDYGTEIIMPADPVQEGHTFLGWTPQPPESMPAENLTLVALWVINSYTVTFDGAGGLLIEGDETQDINHGDSVTPPVYEKKGYTFIGWSEDIGSISEDMDIVALWGMHVRYSFETNGGSPIDPVSAYELDQCLSTSRDGFLFMGWYDNTELSGDPIVFPYRSDVDVTLYAKWNEEDMDLIEMIQVGNEGTIYTIPTGTDDTGTTTVEGGYLMAETETTYDVWYEVRIWAEANGYHFQNQGREGHDGTIGAAPTKNKLEPVTTISWRDAIVWTNAASEMTGFDPVYRTEGGTIIRDSRDSNASAVDAAIQTSNNGYRLPTSHEWEMAARWRNASGDGSIPVDGRYWTPGSHASGATADCTNAKTTALVAWYLSNSLSETHVVGEKAPNHLGIYDMSGNVGEWTYATSGSRSIMRGGSCDHDANHMQLGHSYNNKPDHSDQYFGFRLVRRQ